MGRQKSEWQKKLLNLKFSKDSEITLTQLVEMAETDRRTLAATLSRIVTSERRELIYNTQTVYEAVKKKLEGENF